LSPEQEKAVAVLIQDRRQASEDLFNQLMDYRGGPVQGDKHDRRRQHQIIDRRIQKRLP
jgi:hypothetical protein